MESIKFHFDGGMANNHELNFYEAGRFQYAAARFVYNLERFRQDRKVVGRLSSKVAADIRIKAPQRGSFLQEILIVTAPAIAECAVQVPVEAMVAYAWNKLFPASSVDKELAIELSRQETERARETTAQAEQHTEQMRLMAEVARNGEATTQQALAILEKALEDNRQITLQQGEISRQALQLAAGRTKAEVERQELINEFRDQFSDIDVVESDRLAGQLRKAVPDIALPLRTSADQLDIAGGNTQKSFASLDFETGQAIGSQKIDSNRTTRRGRIKSYDREQGTGKFRYDDFAHPLSFRIPTESKLEVAPRVIRAMQMETVLATVQFIRDQFDNPISLLLWDVYPEDGEN